MCLFDITQTIRLLSESQKRAGEKERGPQQEESRTCGEKSEVKGVRVWLGPGLVTRC